MDSNIPSASETLDQQNINTQIQILKIVEKMDLELYNKQASEFSKLELLPKKHVEYLYKLKNSGFEPKVIYDIGSNVLHWASVAKKIWPNAEIILFEAYPLLEFLYSGYKYHIGCLSDSNNKIVKFYHNEYFPGGNSYYKEDSEHFTDNKYIEMKTSTLDNIVKQKKFPLPDLVKIDVQGAEIDILNGGINSIGNAQRLILELQSVEYNKGAKLVTESLSIVESMGWKCEDPLFCDNGPDGDYGFIKI